MKERPILFQGEMIRAVLAGTKSQTRRAIKGCWGVKDGVPWKAAPVGLACTGVAEIACPYGAPGDRLWVREAHWWFKDERDPVTGYFPPKLTAEDVVYRADGDDGRKVWRPSIHMPRWASRILLEVTELRVQRLQEISEEDAKAEGAERLVWDGSITGADADLIDWPLKEVLHPYRNGYAMLWEQINGDGSWRANPWVWVVVFRRLKP